MQILDSIITVEHLIKCYGEIRAVDDISFTVERGSLFAFLGVNGAGKSTTINMLCSIIKKDRGRVEIDGFDLDKDSDKIKKSIGIVFQGSVLDAELTVKQNLRSRAVLYGMTRKETDARIAYLSEMLDLTPIIGRAYKSLSGGQKRRIDIARALIHQPKILFLDEPTTGLDPSTRLSVWGIIENLVDNSGLTVFLTTHYMEEVVRAAKVIILDSGKIVANGSPDELKNQYTTDFVRVISPRDSSFERILTDENRTFAYKNNSYYVSASDGKDILSFLTRHKKRVTDFEVLKGDMDDVFLAVTGKQLEG